jgi:hypothetical protein
MNFEIDFPTDEEIAQQKQEVMQRVFQKPQTRRLGIRTVFYKSKMIAVISLLIYFVLILFCSAMKSDFENCGFLALAVFPLTYFSFYFFSLLSEEQNEVIELKQSMRYSFMYIINLRMFYASLVAIMLNIILIAICFNDFNNMWSICAAGTTSMLLLALTSLVIYEKTGTSRLSGVLIVVWVIGCLILLKYGSPLYNLIINVIPLAVHIAVSLISFGLFIGFIRKVEKQNAYGF